VRRVLVLALTLAVLPSVASRAGTADGYRLAGIIAVGDDYLGLLELPGAPVVPTGLGVVQQQADDDHVMVRRVDAQAFAA
jgi:hypothetical protein